MEKGGKARRSVLLLWVAVAVACALATGAGYLIADAASGAACTRRSTAALSSLS